MKQLQFISKLFTHFKNGNTGDKVLLFVALLSIVTIPFVTAKYILHTKASTLNAVTIEPETGTFKNGVTLINDASASAGKAVQFNQPGLPAVKNVFVIVMENKDWSKIYKSASAPYINSLLTRPDGAYSSNYRSVLPGENALGYLHPSEPNYIWMEAGTNSFSDYTFTTDSGASASNSTSSVNHLATQLMNSGKSWKAYQEDITGTTCPLSSSGNYAAKHNPFVFFKDISNNNSTASSLCIAHVRPFNELANDLANNTVASYNFITPNLQDDMHDGTIQQGDLWLQANLPAILNSQAYQNGGAIFITWDEDSGSTSNNPFGMILLSPFAKGDGYTNALAYSHSSYVKTIQNIFGLRPYLGHASDSATLDLSDMFVNGLPAMAKAQTKATGQVAGVSTIIATGSTKANNGAGASSLSLTVPAQVQTGNVLLAQVVVNASATVITPPAGWNLVVSTKSSSSILASTYSKVVADGDPNTYTWNLSAAQPASGGLIAFSGVDTINPIDVSSGQYNASTATVTFKQVTTTSTNAMLVGLVGVSGNTSVTPPNTFVEQFDGNDTLSSSGKTSEASVGIQVNAGLSSVPTALSDTGTASNLAQLVALRPSQNTPNVTPDPNLPSATPLPPTATVVPSASPTATVTALPTPVCPYYPATYAGSITTSINAPTDNTYTVWSRILGQNDSSNSYFLQIDNGCVVKVGDMAGSANGAWNWVNYQDGNPATLTNIPLTTGTHTVTLFAAEPNVQLDRIVLTTDSSCIPQDTGDNCGPIATATPSSVPPTDVPTPLPPTDTPPAGPSSTPVPSATPTLIPTATPVPTSTPTPVAGLPISYVAASTGNNGAKATTLVLAKPASAQTGHFLVAHVVVNSSNTTITPPTGWTLLQNSKSGSSVEMNTFYKFAGQSEPASYTFSFNSSQPATGGISAFANVNSVSPVDAKSTKYNSNTKTVSFTQITTTKANDLLMSVVGVSGNTVVTQPTGFTSIYSVNDTLAGNGKTAAIGYALKSTVGITSVPTGTYTVAVSNLAQLIALKGN